MKNKLSLPIILILMIFIGASGVAQESSQEFNARKSLMQEEETKIENYIDSKMDQSIPNEIIQEFYRSNEDEHDEHKMSETEQQNALMQVRRNYWRKDYFTKNPSAKGVYQAKAIPACANGDFETGDFSNYTGEVSVDEYIRGNCDLFTNVPPSQATVINFSPSPMTFSGDFFITTAGGTDPYVGIPLVNSGNHAARINSDQDAIGFTRPEQSVSRLNKDITLTSSDDTIFFAYAPVLYDPSGHNNRKPTFIARIVDATGAECDRICRVADESDAFLDKIVAPGNSADTIRFKDWQCAFLIPCGNAGDVVTLELISTDCGAGGHWGYTYVDDICDTCTIVSDSCNFEGSINILPTDTCVGDTMEVCVEYMLAAQNCNVFSADEIRLFIRQGGAIVGGPLTITNPTGGTACFTVTPGDLPVGTTVGEGFDFYAEIDFTFGSASTTANDYNSNSGLDNDYVFGAECCPEFTLLTCCELTGGSLGSAKNSNQAAIDPKVQKKMDEYKQAVAAKYPSFNASSDGCCDYCDYPDVAFPVFIYDETGTMLIDNSVYFITWSNDPTNNTAIGEVLPNEEVIVTVAGPDSCLWTDTFNLVCCIDPGLPGICCDTIDFEVDLDSLCNFNPCNHPTLQFPVRVSRDGVVITTSDYDFLWSNGTTGDATSVSYNDLPISVTVTDHATGCTTVGTYDIDCGTDSCEVKAPENLKCKLDRDKLYLSWSSVTNAAYYQISFYYNDPDCCRNGQPGSITIPIDVFDTTYTVSASNCFSWTVRAVCADSTTTSAWSQKACSCGPRVCEAKAPERLDCRTTRSSQILSWASVTGADHYEIELYKNDPACCRNGQPGSITIPMDVFDTTYTIGNLTDCFSWRVISVCPDGTTSDWSRSACSCGNSISYPDKSAREKSDNGLGAASDSELHYSALPNPSNDQVTISFHDHSGAKIVNARIIITEISNKEVYQSTISNNEAKKIDVSNLQPGIYVYRIIHEGKVLVNDKLIVE